MIKEKTYCIANDFTAYQIYIYIYIYIYTDDFIIFWNETLLSAENDLLEALYVGICERMFTLEKKFWDELQELHRNRYE